MTTTISTFKSVFYLHIYTSWYSIQSCFTYIQVGTILFAATAGCLLCDWLARRHGGEVEHQVSRATVRGRAGAVLLMWEAPTSPPAEKGAQASKRAGKRTLRPERVVRGARGWLPEP